MALGLGLQFGALATPATRDLLQLAPLGAREWVLVAGAGVLPAAILTRLCRTPPAGTRTARKESR